MTLGGVGLGGGGGGATGHVPPGGDIELGRATDLSLCCCRPYGTVTDAL